MVPTAAATSRTHRQRPCRRELADSGGLPSCPAALVGQGVGDRVQREQRALEPGGADLDADQVEQVVGGELLDLLDRLALDLVRQQRWPAWLMAQPRPVKATSATTPSRIPSIIVIRSPQSGFAPS